MVKSEVEFRSIVQPDGRERVEFIETRTPFLPLAKPKMDRVPVVDWHEKMTSSQRRVLADMRSQSDDDIGLAIEEEDKALVLPAELVAAMDEADALELGMPPSTSLTLQLNGRGLIHDASFAVEPRWLGRGGQQERCDVSGARILVRGKSYRLPQRMFLVWNLVQQLNSAEGLSARQEKLASLRQTLGDEIGGKIEPDGQISRLRIAHAAAFSLDLRVADGEFDFDPVLFRRPTPDSFEEAGTLPDATAEGLLPPSQATAFAQKFRQSATVRNGYVMPDGTFVFLDQGLKRGLELVHQKQRASVEQKREFARNPRLALRELAGLESSDDLEQEYSLFVETEQFSERVRDIEVWRPAVVPWIKPKPHSWLPEVFGLRVGEPPNDQHITVSPERLPELKSTAEHAIQHGRENFVFDGQKYPATPGLLSSIENLLVLEEQANLAIEAEGEIAPKPLSQIYFLQVDDNLEELQFAPLVAASGADDFKLSGLPSALTTTPKPHQEGGIAWLASGWRRGIPGLLLADDMGLGKTFQALAFLAWLKEQEPRMGPVLIVAPSGLLKNWEQEIDLHLQELTLGRLERVYGSGLSRLRTANGNDIRGGNSRLDVSGLRDAGVVLTTFETMRDYHISFAKIRFSVIIYDEIQKLKNPVSQMTRAAKTLNGQLQIGMTGTPVENRLQDLWSISDVIFPGFLGTSKDFENRYSSDDHGALENLHSKLTEHISGTPPFMLRRMKSNILEGLPEKKTVIHEAVMPTGQAMAYDKILFRAQAMRQEGGRGSMLEIIQKLRSVSLHPDDPQSVKDEGEYVAASARLTKTFQILEKIRDADEKALVFCESHAMQEFLSRALQRHFGLPRPVPRINGSVKSADRQSIVNRFQSGPETFDLLILSPKAGGVGLNITAANHVIHLSRWWNPAVEDQATDRVYRIGQTRPVTVHIPLSIHPDPLTAAHSFDKRLDALMTRKRNLSSALLVPPESESDVDYLLAETLDWKPETPLDESNEVVDGASKTTNPASEIDADTDRVKKRRRLTAEDMVPGWAEQSSSQKLSRVVFKSGEVRDWRIFSQYLEEANLKSLKIVDPYVCAHWRQRQQVTAFVQKIRTMSKNISEVEITTYDAESTRSDDRESNEEQREHLKKTWQRMLSDLPLRLDVKSKRAGDDLHDRSVEAVKQDGGKVIWDLGRGIQGIMTAEKDCTVIATESLK